MNEFAIRLKSGDKSSTEKARHAVRPYDPQDREAVRRICCDTGFFGQPIDPLFLDRDLFADLMTGPYLDYEPEWAWVAESCGAVVGYLLASVHPHFDRRQLRASVPIVGRMLWRLMTGRYAGHSATRAYIRWLILRAGRERPRRPPGAAHLHVNLLQGYRGRLGPLLYHSFDRRFRKTGIEDLYGEFFSFPEHRPERAYTRFGFVPFDRRETMLFRGRINKPVHIVCVHRRLSSETGIDGPEHQGDCP